MRDAPALINGITMESALDMIVNTPRHDRKQRSLYGFQRGRIAGAFDLLQQVHEDRLLKEFRRHTDPARERIEHLCQIRRHGGQDVGSDGPRGFLAGHVGGQQRRHLVGFRDQGRAIAGPARRNGGKDLVKQVCRHIAGTVKRFALRRHEDGIGPTAALGQGFGYEHIGFIEGGPTLPVDQNRHIIIIDHLCQNRIVEMGFLHDMAPMTRRVAERRHDRFACPTRLGKRLFAPFTPPYQILAVGLQIG